MLHNHRDGALRSRSNPSFPKGNRSAAAGLKSETRDASAPNRQPARKRGYFSVLVYLCGVFLRVSARLIRSPGCFHPPAAPQAGVGKENDVPHFVLAVRLAVGYGRSVHQSNPSSGGRSRRTVDLLGFRVSLSGMIGKIAAFVVAMLKARLKIR